MSDYSAAVKLLYTESMKNIAVLDAAFAAAKHHDVVIPAKAKEKYAEAKENVRVLGRLFQIADAVPYIGPDKEKMLR